MCGIFGYIGSNSAVKYCLDGLEKLEYRGYDSAGVACLFQQQLHCEKNVGKVRQLKEQVANQFDASSLAIAHTRWATHGLPTWSNAHPHLDQNKAIAIVHNGIIENYLVLRQFLQERKYHFYSETDSEVVANLIAHFYQGNLFQAVKEAILMLEGAFALVVIHSSHGDEMVAAACSSPLTVGIGENELFLASDVHAFYPHANKAIFFQDRTVARLTATDYQFCDFSFAPVKKRLHDLSHEYEEVSKGHYDHFMLKEIYEQPQTIRNVLLSRFVESEGVATFDALNREEMDWSKIERIVILACGSSWHAGLVGSYFLEEQVRVPVQIEISSEFRYKNAVILPNTLVIAISQSGETSDTLAAVQELKRRGATILAICNVQESALVRLADFTLFLRSGKEVGVAATKTFTSTLAVLSLFSLFLSRMHHMGMKESQLYFSALRTIPLQIEQILNQQEKIARIAKKYARYSHFFFLGRHYMYPTSLEGALKLKEISYLNANGYPAGEMKHGPIALIGPNCPTIALCANQLTCDKMRSNIMEVKARKGAVVAIAFQGQKDIGNIADDLLEIPPTEDSLAPITVSVITQLFAYFIAKELNTEIDQPRNLAKTVTVE